MAQTPIVESEYLSQLTDIDATLQGERYLGCHLVPNLTVALSVQKITEVLTIPTAAVTPIPRMSPWVMGVYNWRGEVLWVVDLGHLLGLTPWYQQTTSASFHNMLIARTEDATSSTKMGQKMIGLAVGQVQDIETLDPKTKQPASKSIASPELAPFLRGYWLRESGDLLACLDVDAVFSMIAK
ncbi:MAG: purine-binding chemotaxis protein CheW [Synechococcales cyanobacterium RU_4_20]|nr:purine-binding chemotaxis protein CheW [Synechococcales cyanobacterium RU_4_20]NJR70342.1 purine-binding chemotaxis protein CheW [Synechococcales cyanobacterium CRU_2_2]